MDCLNGLRGVSSMKIPDTTQLRWDTIMKRNISKWIKLKKQGHTTPTGAIRECVVSCMKRDLGDEYEDDDDA